MANKSNLIVILLMILGLSLLPLKTRAQSGKTLVQVFKTLEAKHDIVFSYNPKLLAPLKFQLADLNQTLEGTLQAMSAALPLKFERNNEKGVLVIPIRSTLTFTVNDAEGEIPLDLVYVQLNSEQPKYLLRKEGAFQLGQTFPTDSLTINSSFYQPYKTTVGNVVQSKGKVKLTSNTTDLGDVMVLSYLTSGVNSVLGDHRIEVDMSQLSLIAGETDGDIFQVLQAIPGIRSPNGKPGSLNLRGAPFDQNLLLFDNIPIYHSGHFFGTFSPYNPAIVDKMSVFRGGLPVDRGGRVGGVIDIRSIEQVPDSLSGGLMINTVSTGFDVKAPIVKNKLGIMLSARTKLPGENLPPKLDAYYDLNFQGSRIATTSLVGPLDLRNLEVGFSDLNGKLLFEPNAHHSFNLSFLNIDNDFGYELVSPNRDVVETEQNTLDNWGLTFEWKGELSERLKIRSRITSSSFRLNETRNQFQQGQSRASSSEFVKNGIDDRRADVSLNYQLNATTDLDLGYEYSHHKVTFDDRIEGDNPQQLDRRNGSGDINSLYFSLNNQFNQKLIVNAGLRMNYFSMDNQRFLAPRVFVTYLASKSFFLKASASGSYQYVRQNFADDFDDFRIENQFWTLADENIPALTGSLYMLGGLLDHGSWLFDLEFYTKEVQNVIRPSGAGIENSLGDLYVSGLDLLVKKRWTGLETWISYSLSHAEESFVTERNPPGQREPNRLRQDAFFDQRHVLSFKMIAPIQRWNLSVSWSLMTGLPVYLADADDIRDDQDFRDYNVSYRGNFPVQHQMDLSASYRFTKPSAKWKGVLGMSILNVYNRQNIINAFQENVDVVHPIRYGLGISPNLQLRVTF
ncbi:TonB-dependent receptor plug domain-containing protein [Roseivirga sp.]|uniref:TonB-dependent receptor plug domain-containing protein n=1 Tax=Roseivirga sp. TaxID=1964215 RepID=UPI003B8B14FE